MVFPDILFKRFFALSQFRNRQFHCTEDKAVKERSCVCIIHIPRDVDIYLRVGE